VTPALGPRSIVVGCLPSPEGRAAHEQAKRWARTGSARLVVVNTGRNGDDSIRHHYP
jgi:hypothetical protein